MSIYFSPVLTFKEGPRQLYSAGGGGDLSAVTSPHDGDTRVAYAYLREQPRPTRWVADETPLGEHIIELWGRKYGPGLQNKTCLTRSDIPDSTTEFPIVINHTKREWLDSAEFDFCPLPLLAAYKGADGYAGDPLAARWFGDTVSVSTRQEAELSGIRQIHAGEPRIAEVEPDDRLLCEHPDLAKVLEFICLGRIDPFAVSTRLALSYDDWLNETLTYTAHVFKGTKILDPATQRGVSAWLKRYTTADGRQGIEWATGTGCVRTRAGETLEHALSGSIESTDPGDESIEAAWNYIRRRT